MPDFVIVGHGLAGAVLAHRLIERGHSVAVLDAGLEFSASSISVGLVNPLIGPKLNPPFKIEECLNENQKFFRSCEQAWSQKFYSSLPLHRIFISEKQKGIWQDLKEHSDFKKFAGDIKSSAYYQKLEVHAKLGAGITTDAWQLDVFAFLRASRDILTVTNSMDSVLFDEKSWKDSQKTIFCEGFRVIENPWFKDLPFAPAKGEVLTVQSGIKEGLSNGTWHLPDHAGRAVIGSTWDHEKIITGPTEGGKNEIFKKCDFYDFSKPPPIEHKSGVRSGTRDRHPIIGVHKERKNYFIFNGFGSRGTSTIPYYANKMADFLIDGQPLPPEANVNRFQKSNLS